MVDVCPMRVLDDGATMHRMSRSRATATPRELLPCTAGARAGHRVHRIASLPWLHFAASLRLASFAWLHLLRLASFASLGLASLERPCLLSPSRHRSKKGPAIADRPHRLVWLTCPWFCAFAWLCASHSALSSRLCDLLASVSGSHANQSSRTGHLCFPRPSAWIEPHDSDSSRLAILGEHDSGTSAFWCLLHVRAYVIDHG